MKIQTRFYNWKEDMDVVLNDLIKKDEEVVDDEFKNTHCMTGFSIFIKQ